MASGITFNSKKMRDLEADREGNPMKYRRYAGICCPSLMHHSSYEAFPLPSC